MSSVFLCKFHHLLLLVLSFLIFFSLFFYHPLCILHSLNISIERWRRNYTNPKKDRSVPIDDSTLSMLTNLVLKPARQNQTLGRKNSLKMPPLGDLFQQPYPSRWTELLEVSNTELLVTCQLETEESFDSLTHSKFFLEWRRKSTDYPWESHFYNMWLNHKNKERIKKAQRRRTELCIRTRHLNGPYWVSSPIFSLVG